MNIVFYKNKNLWMLLIVQAFLILGLNTYANAVEVPIDLFEEPINDNLLNPVKDVTVDGNNIIILSNNPENIIQGQRDVSFEITNKLSYALDDGTWVRIVGGQFSLSNDAGTIGIATLQYDGTPGFPGVTVETPDNITYQGLGGLDLKVLGTEITFNVLDTDQGFPIIVEFYSDKTRFTKVEVDTIAGSKVIPFIALENFCGYVRPADPALIPEGVDPSLVSVTCGVDGAVDMSNLGAMQARFNQSLSGVAATGQLDMIIDSIIITGESPLACRVTGGGVEADYSLEDGTIIYAWDGSVENGTPVDDNGDFRYTFGGQVGANTVFPEIAGQWQHNEHGDLGTFAFHAGGKFAKAGTQISKVVCSDPEFCNPARPAPAKQIDFEGVGTFNNIGKGRNLPYFLIADANVIPEPDSKKVIGGYTVHAFEVNIDDAGEGPADSPLDCPVNGFGLHGDEPSITDGELGFCTACSDFYRITIYKGVDVEQYTDENGVVRVIPSELPKTEEDIIYQVFGYHNGNTQIHPPTGFDLRNKR